MNSNQKANPSESGRNERLKAKADEVRQSFNRLENLFSSALKIISIF